VSYLRSALASAMFAATLAFSVLAAALCFADSQARIVRLSDVQGDVQLDRGNGQGFQKAFLNLPLTQGAKLKTNAAARAEVEFEDGSTLRITPDSAVEFAMLSLRDSGTKLSTVNLLKGSAYVTVAGAKNDDFTVAFGHETLRFPQRARVRIKLVADSVSVAVFKGEAEIITATGTTQIAKNETATFDLAGADHETLAKEVKSDPNDSWDKQQDQYHDRYADNTVAGNYSPYAYGGSDLNYYGSFFNQPGYGLLWQPYFAGAGWDPFMNGAWAFYPGFGYGWVSAYPWGWTPFHYGSWAFLPGRGWAWQPGGSWSTYSTMLSVKNPPANFAMPKPPVSGQGMAFVNQGKAFDGREVIKNSAGLGIARGSIRNLGEFSPIVQRQGSALVAGFQPAWRAGDSGFDPRISAHSSIANSGSLAHTTSHVSAGVGVHH